MELKLALQRQAYGEPNHWSLFLSLEGRPGTVYQVKGDATAMHYAHAFNINLLNSTSYITSYILAKPTEQEAALVDYWAYREPPPSAPTQAAVHENCQGWIIRVLRRLVEERIVQQDWLDFAVNLQEPLY